MYVVDIHVRQVQMKLRRADLYAQQVERENETPTRIIVVFPLNCLILMEQRTRTFFFFFFFFFFLIQFYVPFKLFHSYRDESIGRWGENRSTRGKTT